MCIFCRSLFVLLYFVFWSLCCLFFFDLRILITLPFWYLLTLLLRTILNVLWQNSHFISLWSWLYGSWIYNYLYNQCLSPLVLWVRISLRRGVLDTTLCDKVCQWFGASLSFSAGTPVSSTNTSGAKYNNPNPNPLYIGIINLTITAMTALWIK